METRLPWRPTRGSLTSPSYLVRNRTLGPPLENNPEITPSSRDEGLRLLQDRKSTRLNSSHQKISYAVFCLKKKNQAHGSCHKQGERLTDQQRPMERHQG